MSRVAGLLVRSADGRERAVRSLLERTAGVEIVAVDEPGFAILLEAETPRDQEAVHQAIVSRPEVAEALVVFQSTEVEG